MSARTHNIEITKTVQLIDLNNNENKCITTFQIRPSDIAIPYDVAVVSQSMIDSAEGWEGSSTFKRFSGSVTNTVEIDDDTPQSYYLAFKSAPGSADDPLSLDISITSTPLQVPAQEPATIQPVILENFEDEIVKEPWYKTTWGMLIIATILGAVAYFGYKYWMSRKTITADKDVRFKPLVQEKTIPSYTPAPDVPRSTIKTAPDVPRTPIKTAPEFPRTPIKPSSFAFPTHDDSTVKSEYKTHKYRSRDRIKPDFSSSPSRFRRAESVGASIESVKASQTSPPSPVKPINKSTPIIATPPAPVVEAPPSNPEPVNRITSKLFEKLRSGFTVQ